MAARFSDDEVAMDRRAREFRAEIGALKRTRRTEPYPADLRGRITAYVDEQVRQGETYRALSRRLGLRHETLERWHRKGVPMVPVRLVESMELVARSASEATVTVYTPAGWRVEQLPVSAALELLRAVG